METNNGNQKTIKLEIKQTLRENNCVCLWLLECEKKTEQSFGIIKTRRSSSKPIIQPEALRRLNLM